MRTSENPYADLRKQALSISAIEAGVTVADDQVWGVLMDLPLSEATATVVAFADGTASIYLSSGGGFIGGGQQTEIKRAAEAFVETARDAKECFTPAADCPLPASGQVRFYLRIGAQVATAMADEGQLESGRHRLSALFAAGQDVISSYREASK